MAERICKNLGMTSEGRLLEGGSGEAENGEGEAGKKILEGASGEMESENGEGEPEKKKLRKRERVAKMFERDGRATNIAEGFAFDQFSNLAYKPFARLPVAGYIVSAIHAAKGNEEHARRAAGRQV